MNVSKPLISMINPSDSVLKFKNTTVKHSGFEMDIRIEIKKEEDTFSHVNSQTERESSSQDSTMELNNNATVCNKVCEVETKTEFKEEAVISDCCQQNDTGTAVMKINGYNSYSEMNTKIQVKEEELCWQEQTSTEASCVDEIRKDCEEVVLPTTESTRLYREEELSKRNLVLFMDDEYLGRNAPECKIPRRYKSKETDIPEISPINVYSETHEDMEMDTTSLYLKQNSTQVHDLSKRNYCSEAVFVGNYNVCCEYKCNFCDKTFVLASDLKRHKFYHEGKKSHKCDICEKSFAHFSHLKIHKLIHEGKKSHKCDICGKGFTTSSNLNAHKLTHEGQKPHKCDTCGKSFTRLSSLKIHQLALEGHKPYNCDSCGKCFAHISSLKMHKLIHDGKMSYKCNTCGKCFPGLSGLKRHALIHEDIRPYRCDLCGKGFTQLSNLKVHKPIHEDKREHICNICGKGFNQLSTMKKHMLIHEHKSPHHAS